MTPRRHSRRAVEAKPIPALHTRAEVQAALDDFEGWEKVRNLLAISDTGRVLADLAWHALNPPARPLDAYTPYCEGWLDREAALFADEERDS